jgi:branched-chain amino acid transport system permease protein
MVGVYLSYFVGTLMAKEGIWGGLFAALAVAMMGCMVLGISIERIAYRPLRTKPRLTMLITALGVSIFLQNFLALDPHHVPPPFRFIVFGPEFRSFPELIKERSFELFGLVFSNIKFINLGITLFLMVMLHWIVKHTMIGKAMRATAFNKEVAKLMGIDIDRVIMFTFAMGSILAGVAGTLFGLTYGVVQSPYLGFWPGIVAFVAAVIGGIGNIPGAMLGGFLMGMVETIAISINSNLGFSVTFIILILVLLFRPTGLLGTPYVEKI